MSRDDDDDSGKTPGAGPVTVPSQRRARTRPATQPKPRPKRLPPYAVVVLNDDQHSFPFVIETLQRVFGYGWLKAFTLTWKIHALGRGAVWTGPLEVAEFKRERIRACGPDIYASRSVEFPLGCELEPLA